MAIKIRRCRDYNLIGSLEKQCFHPSEFVEDKHAHTWWVVWDGKEPVGYASIQQWSDKICFLSSCGLLENVRGKGIQKRLIATRERFARAAGNRIMVTYTSMTNVASINSLIRVGYKTYRPLYRWVGKDFVYWQKALQET